MTAFWLKSKNSLRSNSLNFLTPKASHFLNAGFMRPVGAFIQEITFRNKIEF